VHSPRLIQARAAEIVTELMRSWDFSPTQRLAVHEAARCMAILEAIDRGSLLRMGQCILTVNGH
jgi:hypothetical protein